MLKVQRLTRPNKRSGYELEAGGTTSVRGLTIVNKNGFSVWVDKFTRHPRKKK